MGDLSQRARRLTGAVDDLRSRRTRAPKARPPDPEAAILRRLEAVERALEQLVLELRAGGRETTTPARGEPATDARSDADRPEDGADPRIELDDPFGLLTTEPGSPGRNGRER